VFKTLDSVSNFVRALISLAIVVVIGLGGWIAYQTFFGDKLRAQQELREREKELEATKREIARLGEELTASQEQVEHLETAMRLLKVDHRVAQIDVISQQGSAETGDLVTSFTFAEVDDEGNALEEPRLFSVKGDIVYVDSWVVKFDDEYVEQDDPLRSTSVCLFRRVFGETQKPTDGFVLDPIGSRPAAYRNGGKLSEFEQKIWAKFWQYANDPALAAQDGVRAAHGEAPFQKLLPGKRYRVTLRASGGLSFEPPEDIPPDAKPPRVAEAL
jgi:cell division protein FtsB